MTDIFREVEEDVRSARLKGLWDRYGLLVIGSAFAIVVVTGIWVYWQDMQRGQREAAADQFLAGEKLLLDGKPVEAAAHFAEMASETRIGGYALLARMKEAAAKVDAGDGQGAVAAYDALAADSAMDPLLRAVSSLKASLLLFDTASPDELKLRLNPLAKDESPVRHSAREMLAFLALRENSIDEARKQFQMLADALDAPQGIRARAAEILRTLPPVIVAAPPSAGPVKK
ncbi:MAG: tetratricopeptide repeat protein [Alphaproteobacteria bacterium]